MKMFVLDTNPEGPCYFVVANSREEAAKLLNANELCYITAEPDKLHEHEIVHGLMYNSNMNKFSLTLG